jgi:hypothetical protein
MQLSISKIGFLAGWQKNAVTPMVNITYLKTVYQLHLAALAVLSLN